MVQVGPGHIEQKTTSTPILVHDDFVHWEEEIVLPRGPYSVVRIALCASSGMEQVSGDGETLYTREISVEDLFDLSARMQPIPLSPSRAEVDSCCSLFLTVERRSSDCDEPTSVADQSPYISCGPGETSGPAQLTDDRHAVILKHKNGVHNTLGPPPLPPKPTTSTMPREPPLNDFQYYSHNYILDDIVRTIPDANQDRQHRIIGLAISIPEEFEQSIPEWEDAFERSAENINNRRALAFNLGNAFLGRFDRIGEITDIDRSISMFQEAAELARGDDLDRARILSRVGISLLRRFERLSHAVDINESIVVFEEVLRLVSEDHPDRPGKLSDLSLAFLRRFEHFHTLADLDKSASLMLRVVELTPDDHPHKLVRLYILGSSFKARFRRRGDLLDLHKSILVEEEALRLIPATRRDRVRRLSSLHCLLMTRFHRIGHIADLDRCTTLMDELLQFVPDGYHAVRMGWRLVSLAEISLARFRCLGGQADLDKCISLAKEALQSIPDRHATSPLGCLATAFLMRFQLRGEPADLYQSIPLLEKAVLLAPNGHSDRPALLLNFGVSLAARFDQRGNITDIDNSILVGEEALRLMPDHHHSKPTVFYALGHSYTRRFEHLGNLADLDKAISMIEEGLRVAPHENIEKPRMLFGLGSSLIRYFQRLHNPADLDKAIVTLDKALHLMPDRHPLKASTLTQLAASYQQRFVLFRNTSDIDKSIALAEQAMKVTPNNSTSQPLCLFNLGVFLLNRFVKLGNLADLSEAASAIEEVLRVIPEFHSARPQVNIELGSLFVFSFQRTHDFHALDAAISNFADAARSSVGPLSIRFTASKHWVQYARDAKHHSLLEAYECAINLLPQFAWIGVSLKDRYKELLEAAEITQNAASVAVALGHTDKAVEWLEQGRSIVWGQLLQLRTPLDELRYAHPDLADQLGWLSHALEQTTTTVDQSSLLLTGVQPMTVKSAEQQAQRYRGQLFEREKLLEQVRALPGFERFLLPKKFSQLQACAYAGPVICLNANTTHVDALIIVTDLAKPMHISLTNMTKSHAEHLAMLMKKSLGNEGRVISRENRAARLAVEGGHGFDYILAELWMKLVRPILHVLGLLRTPGKLSRVFWCPTGPLSFLPIHAAGIFDHPGFGNKASDFIISSYVPTLSVLSPSRQRNIIPGHVHLLAVPQPHSDGQVRLSGARTEIDYIKATISESSNYVTIRESSGIVDNVLDGMEKSDWVHFACHGIQDLENPTDSGLCLADKRRLRLSDIIQLSRPSGGLAFLSACQTATGDAELSEEAVHLAAGMLFAGYGSVIATMWSIRDSVAPDLAKDVYEQLFRDGRMPDCREAAGALHHAVERLRQRGEPFITWVPFIHIGL